MSKPREFEIKRNDNNCRGIKYFCREKIEGQKPFSSPWLTAEIIHVIEYSAYTALAEKVERYEKALEKMSKEGCLECSYQIEAQIALEKAEKV